MDIRYFIGIDVSKAVLDWAVYGPEGICLQTQSANTPVGVRKILKALARLPGFSGLQQVFCLEHTARRTVGIYNARILNELHKKRGLDLVGSQRHRPSDCTSNKPEACNAANRTAPADRPSMPCGLLRMPTASKTDSVPGNPRETSSRNSLS